jgi:hypothetical protein
MQVSGTIVLLPLQANYDKGHCYWDVTTLLILLQRLRTYRGIEMKSK